MYQRGCMVGGVYPGWCVAGGTGSVVYRVLTQPSDLRLIYGIRGLIGSYGRLTGISVYNLRSEISGIWVSGLDLDLDLDLDPGPDPGTASDWSLDRPQES